MKMERIAVVGAGSIGGCIGTWLAAHADVPVAALARGATLAALRRHGWRLDGADGALQAPVAKASDDPAALGEQDLLVLAVKAPALAALAPTLAPMIGPHTVILPAMNGVPWWFGLGLPGPAAGMRLDAVDPVGAIADALPPQQVIGCVVHMAALQVEPGRVEHRMGRGLVIGEPSGQRSERLDAVYELLRRARIDASVPASIHEALWYKLWGNVTMNPVSALTGAATDAMLDDPLVRGFCSAVMTEVAAIGARIGCAVEQTPEDRHAVTRKLGAFKTSMLQDVEAGRAIELDAIVGAVRDIAAVVGQPAPNLDALYALTRLMARTRGLLA